MSRKNISSIYAADVVYTPFIGGYWTRRLKIFILLHIALFLSQWFTLAIWREDIVQQWFAIIPGTPYYSWRIATYCLVHSRFPLEILFSVGILAFMAGDLERNWGSGYFFFFYCACQISSGAMAISFANDYAYFGSMAGSIGIIAALGFSHPQRSVYGRFFLKHFLPVIAGLYIVLLWLVHYSWPMVLSGLTGIPLAAIAVFMLPKIQKKLLTRGLLAESKHIHKLDMLRERADILLDKVSQQGFTSLAQSEKKFLKRFGVILKRELSRKQRHSNS